MEFQGCADSDGDKIPDGNDLCPNVKGSATTDGCPDDDGDGIKNSVDLCPAFSGTAEFGGCPDTDNDGIIDKEDDCPTLKGIKPNKGCPEVSADVKLKMDVIFKNLLFATNSANIDATSLDDLDELIKIMSDDEDLRLSIEGHTDNRGNNEYNLELSRLRAEAVKQYLVNGGISASRINAVGYGETRPITTNETANGRLKNRRVELNISYK